MLVEFTFKSFDEDGITLQWEKREEQDTPVVVYAYQEPMEPTELID